ncbi:hypothetical protein HQN90_36845 [Paenibacillus alba]|uniref:hypothetical protein n=1 Tax=Paenibacillus alba TaxID=1197127 RepID=UPI001567B2B5|nr:hypothetical protein [Paenibacillus alba]NQX71661.1 hypothetical protein [Paenibacillus alba]
MKELDVKQISSLLVGTGLACEISASSDNNRAFVKVQVIENQKYLNSQDKNVAHFFLRKYEVPADYIENDWDVTDEVLIGSVHIIGIKGIKQLVFHLNMYVDDLSSLVGEWKCDNPL